MPEETGLDKFWADKSKEVQDRLEPNEEPEEDVEDEEEIPEEEPESEEETEEEAEEEEEEEDTSDEEPEVDEKEARIQALESELMLLKAEKTQKAEPPQQKAVQEPQITAEQYFEKLNNLRDNDPEFGEYRAMVMIAQDIAQEIIQQEKKAEQERKNELTRYGKEVKSKYGNHISDDKIQEMYDLTVKIRNGEGNPVELLLLTGAKEKAIKSQREKNERKRIHTNKKYKKGVSSPTRKAGKTNISSSVQNADKKLAEAKKQGNVGGILDGLFNKNLATLKARQGNKMR